MVRHTLLLAFSCFLYLLWGCTPATPQKVLVNTPLFSTSPSSRPSKTPDNFGIQITRQTNQDSGNSSFPSPVRVESTLTRTQQIKEAIPTATPGQIGKKNIVTAQPPQSNLVLDPIQIRSPGAMSIVTSPISLNVQFAMDGAGKILRIGLYSEDGKLLVRKVFDWKRVTALGGSLHDLIDFEIPNPSQNGLLNIQVEDTLGLLLAVNSTSLVLRSSGVPQINPPEWQAKVIDIQQPAPNAQINGGMLAVSGLTSLEIDQVLKVQLLSLDGKVLGQRLAGIRGSPEDEFKVFTSQVPYITEQGVPARLIVFYDDSQFGQTTHLTSLPVTLNP